MDIAVAQHCIDCLLKPIEEGTDHDSTMRRLRLTAISLISAVNAQLLPSLLENIRRHIIDTKDEAKRDELCRAAFKEVQGGVADAEKEIVMVWWMDLRKELSKLDSGPVVDELPETR